MPYPDSSDDTTKASPAIQTSSPFPSLIPNDTLQSPLDFRSNVANNKAQTNSPTVHAPGLENEDPRSRTNGNILNLDVTTPGQSDNTTSSINVSQSNSPTQVEETDERGRKKSRPKPSPLSDSTKKRPRKLSAAQVVELTSQPLSPQSIPQEVKEATVPELKPAAELETRLAPVLDQDHDSSDDSRGRSTVNEIHLKKSFERREQDKEGKK